MRACIFHSPGSPDTSQSELHIPSPVSHGGSTRINTTCCADFIRFNYEANHTPKALQGSAEESDNCSLCNKMSAKCTNNMGQGTPATLRSEEKFWGDETSRRAFSNSRHLSLADTGDSETSHTLDSEFRSVSGSPLNEPPLLFLRRHQKNQQLQRQQHGESCEGEEQRGLSMSSPTPRALTYAGCVKSLSCRPKQKSLRRLTSPLPDDREEISSCLTTMQQEEEEGCGVNIPSPFPFARMQTNPLQAGVDTEMKPVRWRRLHGESSFPVHLSNAKFETPQGGRQEPLNKKISSWTCSFPSAVASSTQCEDLQPEFEPEPWPVSRSHRLSTVPPEELYDWPTPQEFLAQTPSYEELQQLGSSKSVDAAVLPTSRNIQETAAMSTPAANIDTSTPELVDWHFVVEEPTISLDVTVVTEDEGEYHDNQQQQQPKKLPLPVQRSATQPPLSHSCESTGCATTSWPPSIVSVADNSLDEMSLYANTSRHDVVIRGLLSTLAVSGNAPGEKMLPQSSLVGSGKIKSSHQCETRDSTAAPFHLMVELCRAVFPFARRLLLLLLHLQETDNCTSFTPDTCAEAVNRILEEEGVLHVRATRRLCSYIVAASGLGEDGCRTVPCATFVASVVQLAGGG